MSHPLPTGQSIVQAKANAGTVDQEKAQEALELFDRVRALTWRLIRPPR